MKRIATIFAVIFSLFIVVPPTTASADVTSSKAVQGFNIQGQGGQQLNSSNSKTVYCQMKKSGFNTAVLNFTLAQDTRTSIRIHTRSTIHNRSGTPTDAQLATATRNARACGLKVVYKPHLEVESGGWRGRIGTIGENKTDVRNAWKSDAQNAAWHKAWRSTLIHYAKVGKANKFSGIVIGTEMWGTTLTSAFGHSLNPNNGIRWANTAKEVKKIVGSGVTVSYAAHAAYELRYLPTVFGKSKYLDRVDITYYPKPTTASTTVASYRANMEKDRKRYFVDVQRRYHKPMVIAEVGFLSLKYGSRHLQYNGATWRDVDLTAQKNQYAAFLAFANTLPIKGVMLYRVVNDPKAGGSGDIGFTWQQKPAATVINNTFS